MTKFDNKVLHFTTALMDVYRDDEERELPSLGKMEWIDDELTEDFTAMLCAMSVLYDRITGENSHIVDFTHLLNKLAIQKLMESKDD